MLGFPKLLTHCLVHETSLLLPAHNKQQTFLGMARAKHTGTAQHAHMGYSLRVYTAPDVPASAPPPMIICCTNDEFDRGKFGS